MGGQPDKPVPLFLLYSSPAHLWFLLLFVDEIRFLLGGRLLYLLELFLLYTNILLLLFLVYLAVELDLLMNFVFLIKNFNAQIIASAILLDIHLDLLTQMVIHHNSSSLSQTFIPCWKIFYPFNFLPQSPQLLTFLNLHMLWWKLSDQSVEPSTFLELGLGFAIGLIKFRNHLNFLGETRCHLIALIAVGLRTNVVKKLLTAGGADFKGGSILVDHEITIIRARHLDQQWTLNADV